MGNVPDPLALKKKNPLAVPGIKLGTPRSAVGVCMSVRKNFKVYFLPKTAVQWSIYAIYRQGKEYFEHVKMPYFTPLARGRFRNAELSMVFPERGKSQPFALKIEN